MSTLPTNRRNFLAVTGATLAGTSAWGGGSTAHTAAADKKTGDVNIAAGLAKQSEDGVVYHSSKPPVMQGFPPAKAARVTIDNWADSTANIRWTHVNTASVFRSAVIDRRDGDVWALPRRMLDPTVLGRATVRWGNSRDEGDKISVDEWLRKSETDALIVLHDGHIVAEQYFGEMTPKKRHLLWSASKSVLASLLAPLLVSKKIDEQAQVTSYLPELAGSGFAGATVRQLLDMNTGIACRCFPSAKELGLGNQPLPSEWTFGRAEFRRAGHEFAKNTRVMGIFPSLPQEHGTGYYDFLTTIQRDRDHGQYFYYTDPNPMALQWILERTTGRSYLEHVQDLLDELGAEQNATVMLDPIGTSVGTVGLALTARDFARWGQMLCDGGRTGTGAVRSGIGELIDDVRRNPGRERWTEKTNFWESNPRHIGYRSLFWTSQLPGDRFATPHASGFNWQKCIIDKDHRTVVVKFSSLWDEVSEKPRNKHEELFEITALDSFVEALRGFFH